MHARCPFCASLEALPLSKDYLRCQLCTMAFRSYDQPRPRLQSYVTGRDDYAFPNWNTWFFRTTRHLASSDPWLFTRQAIRLWALQEGLRPSALGTTFLGQTLDWTYGRVIKGRFAPLGTVVAVPLTLGVLAAPTALDDVAELCADMSGLVAAVVIALDASSADEAVQRRLEAVCGVPVTLIVHPLDGDFAAQRNRIQAASPSPWVLQLDTDERLTSAAKQKLPWLLAEAEHTGWQALALPRQNIVDGMVSAHYPDVQYRMLRKDVRYVRRVHEYPLVPRGTSVVALGADIRHLMAGERLARREHIYETLLPGAGRPHDTALLRLPLEPGVSFAS